MQALAEATRAAMQSKGLTQEVAARTIHRHRTWISHFVNGRGTSDPEALRELAKELDCAWLYKALHQALCGVVFVHRKLDGDMVDLHRSSVKAKLLEELGEAIEVIKGVDLVNRPQQPLSDDDKRRVIEEELFPALGAECSIETYVAVRCEELGISPSEVYERWNSRMEEMGYVKRRGR